MNNDVLIVLGSLNTPSGKLSDIALSRLNHCNDIYEEGNLVLCTGGWGEHFNTSSIAHASYAKAYLVEKGLSEKVFLEFALSENTVDDAIKIKAIISKLENINLTVITSDYHLDRVKLIFEKILENHSMKFFGVECDLAKDQYDSLVQHEKKAIQAIMDNGLYF